MFWGFLFIAIGLGWILQYYEIIPKDFEFFWPLIFIVLGLYIILRKKNAGSNWCCGDWIDTKDKDRKK